MAGSNPINLSDLFNFGDRSELQATISDIKTLRAAYDEFFQVVINGQMKSLASQQDDVRASIKTLVEESTKLNITNKQGQDALVAQANEIENLKKQLEDLIRTKKAVKDVEDAQKNSVDGLSASLKAQLAEYNRLDPTIEANFQRMTELSRGIRATREAMTQLTGETKIATQSFTAAKGSYQALDAETKQLIRDLKSLEGGLDGTNTQAKALQAQIFENTSKLKAFDATMNQNFRNVGNYASAFKGLRPQFDGLGNSIQQIGRELPSVAVSLNTFFLAISNNLPILFDELTRARQAQEAATAAGIAASEAAGLQARETAITTGTILAELEAIQVNTRAQAIASGASIEAAEAQAIEARQTAINTGAIAAQIKVLQEQAASQALANSEASAVPSIGRRVLSSIFSINTLLTLGVVALTLFGGKIYDAFTGVDEATKAAAEANKKYVESLREIDRTSTATAQTEVARLVLLSRAAADVRNSIQTRIAAVDELKKRFPEYFANLEREAFLNGKAAGAIRDASRAIFEKAAGEASFDKFKKVGEQVGDLQDRLDGVNSKIENIFSGADQATKNYIKTKDAADKLFYSGKKDTEEYLKLTQKATLIFQNLPIDEGAIAKIRDLKKEAAGLGSEITEAQIKQQNLLLASQKSSAAVAAINDKILGDGRTPARIKKELEDVNKQLEFTNVNTTKSAELLKKQTALQDELSAAQGKQSATEKERIRTAKAEETQYQKLLRERLQIIKANEALDLAAAELALARTKKTSSDQVAYEEERIRIATKYATQREALYPKGSKEYAEAEKDRIQTTAHSEEEITKIGEKASEERFKRQETFYKELYKVAGELQELNKSNLELVATGEDNSLRLQRAKREITEGQLNDLVHANNARRIQDNIDRIDRELAAEGLGISKRIELEKEKNSQLAALNTENTDFQIAEIERVRSANEQVLQASFQFASTLANAYSDIVTSNIQEESDAIAKQKEYELQLAGENDVAKKKINDNYAKKEAELRTREANAQKQAALFEIAINTAAAIVAALKVGPPQGFILAGLAAAAGVAQAIVVSSKKVPQYFKGRDLGKNEDAEVNEKGFEFIERRGEYRIAGKGERTITTLSHEDRVLTHEQSVKVLKEEFTNRQTSDTFMKSLLSGTGAYIKSERQKDERLAQMISSSMNQNAIIDGFDKAVSKIPVELHQYNEDGYRRFTIKKNTIIENVHERQKMGGNG